MGATPAVGRVLIVGGGIAGLTLANGLRSIGVSVVVADLPSKQGGGIGFWSFGVRALEQIDLKDLALANGYVNDTVRLADSAGNLMRTVINPRIDGYPPELILGRRDFIDALREEALRRGADIRMPCSVKDILELSEGTQVTLTDGSSDVYDMVIGADGAYSYMRRHYMGIEQLPELTGSGAWRTLLPASPLVPSGRIFFTEEHSTFMYPCGNDQIFASVVEREMQPKRNPEESREHVLRLLEAYTAPEIELLRSGVDSWTTPVVYRPLSWLLLPAPWHKGRLLLIGDAAHTAAPMLSSGGGMAVEDAVVLTELIARGDRVEAVIEKFMVRRVPRVSRVWEDSYTVHEEGNQPGSWNAASTTVRDALDFLLPSP